MNAWLRFKIPMAAALAAVSFSSSQAVQVDVYVDRPPGVINFVYPEYPPKLATYGMGGKGVFRLTVNQKTGVVEEVKVIKSTGHALLNEYSAKAFFQWRFRPGSPSQVQVLCEFYAHGFSRILH